jgi:hypothetical protein
VDILSTRTRRAPDHGPRPRGDPGRATGSASSPPAPAITASVDGDRLTIAYDTHVDDAVGPVVAVGDHSDHFAPVVHQIPISTRTGSIVVPGAAGEQPQEVQVSVAAHDGAASPATHSPIA